MFLKHIHSTYSFIHVRLTPFYLKSIQQSKTQEYNCSYLEHYITWIDRIGMGNCLRFDAN